MKYRLTLLLFIYSLQTTTAKIHNIAQLGADPTGTTPCTGIIRQAITRAGEEGGGTLYFPAGTYLTGSIELVSNITLHIEAGATLKFSDKFEDYLPFKEVRWEGVVMNTFAPLINARDARNITITGRGTLDGQGFAWWDDANTIKQQIRSTGTVQTLTPLQKQWDQANPDLQVSDYYKSTLERRFFRPPFIQFYACENILIEHVTIINSPFWTINPEFCDNVVVHAVTIHNPSKDPKGPNTDGINPSSCRNVRISDCFISVGDDCITIKSGRDADGRKYNRPCENITITNCVMLSGHGGVVIGSEMSGGVKKVTISNCVFNGTDAGIRLKASRGRGGIVEEIRVNNIVMNDIQKNAFIFDLFYDKTSHPEPISERTPVFRNIHLSNITGSDIRKIGYITGIEEMPVSNISFSNINMSAREGFTAETARNIRFYNVDFSVETGSPFIFTDVHDVILNDIRTENPQPGTPVVTFENVTGAYITNCYQITPADKFYESKNSELIWGTNEFKNIRNPQQQQLK